MSNLPLSLENMLVLVFSVKGVFAGWVLLSIGLSQTLTGGAWNNEQRDSSLPEPVQVSAKSAILHVFSPKTNNFVFIPF